MMRTRISILAVLAIFTAGCGDSLLGGRCSEGYVSIENGGCVSISSDGGSSDDGAANPDGNELGSDSGSSDGGVCGEQRMLCSGHCINTLSDPLNCGACGNACDSNLCARGQCVVECPAPTVNCDGSCADLETDPTNCGGCGIVCRSGLCNAGVCRDARAGHLVLIGHSYVETRADQDRLLANAVFLAANLPNRVLALETYADVSLRGEVASVDASITRGAGGRRWNKTVVTAVDAVPHMLSIDRFDALLVYPQLSATDDQVEAMASTIGPAMTSFVRAGGVVIVLDGGGSNHGTYPVANATGLLSITGSIRCDGNPITLVAPLDALAAGVSTTYRAEIDSVGFIGNMHDAVYQDESDSVVLHRAVVP